MTQWCHMFSIRIPSYSLATFINIHNEFFHKPDTNHKNRIKTHLMAFSKWSNPFLTIWHNVNKSQKWVRSVSSIYFHFIFNLKIRDSVLHLITRKQLYTFIILERVKDSISFFVLFSLFVSDTFSYEGNGKIGNRKQEF